MPNYSMLFVLVAVNGIVGCVLQLTKMTKQHSGLSHAGVVGLQSGFIRHVFSGGLMRNRKEIQPLKCRVLSVILSISLYTPFKVLKNTFFVSFLTA